MKREIDGVKREGAGMSVGRRPRVAPRSEEGSGSDSGEDDDDGSESESEESDGDDGWGVDWRYQASGPQKSNSNAKLRALSFASTTTTSTLSDDPSRDYRDYRATQRTTFLIAHTARREKSIREEMGVFGEVMVALREEAEGGRGLGDEGVREGWRWGDNSEEKEKAKGKSLAGEEEFTLDCHDLSLENVFVDERDPSKIVCPLPSHPLLFH